MYGSTPSQREVLRRSELFAQLTDSELDSILQHTTVSHFPQGEQIFATTDALAERVRKVGGTTLRSIGDIARHQSLRDNDAPFVAPNDMLRELMADNKAMAAALRKVHEIADKHEDVATASLLENYIDDTERRTWFLFEASRSPDKSGH